MAALDVCVSLLFSVQFSSCLRERLAIELALHCQDDMLEAVDLLGQPVMCQG